MEKILYSHHYSFLSELTNVSFALMTSKVDKFREVLEIIFCDSVVNVPEQCDKNKLMQKITHKLSAATFVRLCFTRFAITKFVIKFRKLQTTSPTTNCFVQNIFFPFLKPPSTCITAATPTSPI